MSNLNISDWIHYDTTSYDSNYDQKVHDLIHQELSIRYPDYAHDVQIDFEELSQFWLAKDHEDNVIGTVWLQITWITAELKKLFVSNNIRIQEKTQWISQSEKLSQRLFDHASEYARTQWTKELTLSTSNPHAVKFYEKNGLQPLSSEGNIISMKKDIE